MIVVPHQTGKHQQLKSYIAQSVKENKKNNQQTFILPAKHMFTCCQQELMMVSRCQQILQFTPHKIHAHYIRNLSGVFPCSRFKFDRSKTKLPS